MQDASRYVDRPSLDLEWAELQASMLRMYLAGAFCAGLLWFCYALFVPGPNGPIIVPTIVLFAGTLVGALLTDRSYPLACLALLIAMILALGSIIRTLPSPLAPALGVIVVIAAHALLGAPIALMVVGAITPIVGAAAPVLAPTSSASTMGAMAILGLYLLTLAVCWVAARPLRASVETSLLGWTRAREALDEVRRRRGELNRVLRSLEEATYRIERMNNELTVAQHEAEKARTIKARFVATVSHELRSPLNLIIGYSRLMVLSPESYGGPLPPAYRMDIDTIYRSAQHLVTLVDDVLDLTQIESQRLPLVKDRMDLGADVVARVAQMMRPIAERKGLYLHVHVSPSLPWIFADQVRLRQVLVNLLANAIRFTENGGITIRVTAQQGAVYIGVQDTGHGISPELVPKLFREFEQLQYTETREERGSGLGLAIAKHLIELHGGRIWVESSVGSGTTFWFTLPLPSESAQIPAGADTEAGTRGRDHNTVLLLHRDLSIVRVLGRHLEGYHVVGVPDVDDAFALTERLHPRAIVASDENAGSLWQRLSATCFDVPLISCAMPELSNQFQHRGIVGYLLKPVTPEMLGAVMNSLPQRDEMTVLVTDDDPNAVRLIERMLTALPHPYRILKAYDGQQALDNMRRERPDVLFLDLLLPELDGEQVLANMRDDPCLCDVPVIVVSAKSWLEQEATLGGAIHVRRREPFDLTSGVECLRALLNALHPTYLPGQRSRESS